MNRFGLTGALVIVLACGVGCSGAAYNPATVSQQEAGDGYCRKKCNLLGPRMS
jgi:hypothetical protein